MKQKKLLPPPPQAELDKARKDMNYCLARIYTRAIADIMRGRNDV